MATRTVDPNANKTIAAITVPAGPPREQLIAVLAGQTPDDVSYDVDVALDHVEGLTPDMPISTSLSEQVNAIVRVIAVRSVENQFHGERPDSSPVAAEFVWQDMEDGRYYRAVSSSALALRNAQTMGDLLKKYPAVRARVIGVPVKGQANDAMGFGPVERQD